MGHPFEHGFDLQLIPKKLQEPSKWKKPRTIFVNSMSDMLHHRVPTEYIRQACDVMMGASQHCYQVLTKRSDRLLEILSMPLFADAAKADHIWWGVSVEDKQYGLPRLKDLQNTPARNRFLSVEPLLEDLGEIDLHGIGWVIVGGESGPRSRPIDPEWVRSIRTQCADSSVPFFFKQWGGVRKKLTGRLLDGQTYDERPAFMLK